MPWTLDHEILCLENQGESIIAFGNCASDVEYKNVAGGGPVDGPDGQVEIDIAYGPKSEVISELWNRFFKSKRRIPN